jgi:hypothetical protein
VTRGFEHKHKKIECGLGATLDFLSARLSEPRCERLRQLSAADMGHTIHANKATVAELALPHHPNSHVASSTSSELITWHSKSNNEQLFSFIRFF